MSNAKPNHHRLHLELLSVLIEAVNAAFAVVVGFEADITVAITFIEAQFVFLVEFCVLTIEDFCIGPVAADDAEAIATPEPSASPQLDMTEVHAVQAQARLAERIRNNFPRRRIHKWRKERDQT